MSEILKIVAASDKLRLGTKFHPYVETKWSVSTTIDSRVYTTTKSRSASAKENHSARLIQTDVYLHHWW